MDDEIIIVTRHLPHWVLEGAVYFVTFSTKNGLILSEIEQEIVKNHIIEGQNKYYKLVSFVVMPNHIHILLIPTYNYTLQRIMKGIKGVSAHKINLNRNIQNTLKSTSHVWQDESYDRIIRDAKDLNEKLEYIFFNPAKNGLTENPRNYPGYFLNEELVDDLSIK